MQEAYLRPGFNVLKRDSAKVEQQGQDELVFRHSQPCIQVGDEVHMLSPHGERFQLLQLGPLGSQLLQVVERECKQDGGENDVERHE